MKRLQDIIPIIILILSFIYVCKTICDPVELHKVFHHIDDQVSLNIGKLIFYFDSPPKVEVKKIKRTEFIYEYVFAFQDTTVASGEAQEMINTIDKGRYPYDVSIKKNGTQKNVVLVSLTFDERDIGFTSQEFIAITGENAIAINFYSKVLLQQLEKKEDLPVLQTTWNGIAPTICIDCGHGGKDSGAIGAQGIREKNVCLALGKQVGNELKKNGIPVVYTRDSDVFVPLESRTKYAHAMGADMFISIHANATTNRSVSGVETYCCNPFFLHNRITTFDNRDVQIIMQLEQKRFQNSLALAHEVHEAVCQVSKKYNDYFFDRKIKHGAAQVLFASSVPAVLVEVGFISHQAEEQLLASQVYQTHLAQSIAHGIQKFIL